MRLVVLYFDLGGERFHSRAWCGYEAGCKYGANSLLFYRCRSSSATCHFSLFRHYELLRQQGCLPEECLTKCVFARQPVSGTCFVESAQ